MTTQYRTAPHLTRRLLTYVILLLLASTALAQPAATPRPEATNLSIIPKPVRIEPREGAFALGPATAIVVHSGDDDVKAVGILLRSWLTRAIGAQPKIRGAESAAAPAGTIFLTSDGADAALGDEGYTLTVTPDAIILRAAKAPGFHHAMQTLRQLLPPEWETPASAGAEPRSQLVPCVHIADTPRYRWRGMLLDCGRHFMDKEFVKRCIDLLAYHKMNVLHWHLTEDQGWRIEIQQFPKLTGVGAWRKATRDSEQPRDSAGRYGGFYTQRDVREIVMYAQSRGVIVVPEIEMPGHCGAALAAYPQLSCTGGPFEVCTTWGVHEDVYCAGNEETFAFLEGVLGEVAALFPGAYIHIGGDECPKTRWKACAKCQARIKAEGLADEHELQSWFVRRVEKILAEKGKRLIGWDEILEGGLAPNSTVQSWRGFDGAVAAATAGHDVISSPTSHCYLDYAQVRLPGEPTFMGFLPLERVYAFEPTPPQLSPEQARHVLGGQGNMWTEHAPPDRVERQVFPRLCALSEALWSPAAGRNYEHFVRRLETHELRLSAIGVSYFRPPHDAATPVAREDNEWWMARQAELNRRVREGEPRILFIGDSITQGWEDAGREVWAERLAPLGAVNLGISGDRTQHVLWRLDHGNLAGLDAPGRSPTLAVVMIGTNNSNGNDNTAEQIADGIVLIVDKLRARLPETDVLLLAIFPRGQQPDAQREKNALASRLAAERLSGDEHVHYFDIGERFLAPDGTLPAGIMPDYLHLSPKGYEIWAEAMAEHLSLYAK